MKKYRYMIVSLIDEIDENVFNSQIKQIEGFKYAIWQVEQSSSFKHIQLYIEFDSKNGIEKLKQLLQKCHVEIATGTREQCIYYCSKDYRRFKGPYELVK